MKYALELKLLVPRKAYQLKSIEEQNEICCDLWSLSASDVPRFLTMWWGDNSFAHRKSRDQMRSLIL